MLVYYQLNTNQKRDLALRTEIRGKDKILTPIRRNYLYIASTPRPFQDLALVNQPNNE